MVKVFLGTKEGLVVHSTIMRHNWKVKLLLTWAEEVYLFASKERHSPPIMLEWLVATTEENEVIVAVASTQKLNWWCWGMALCYLQWNRGKSIPGGNTGTILLQGSCRGNAGPTLVLEEKVATWKLNSPTISLLKMRRLWRRASQKKGWPSNTDGIQEEKKRQKEKEEAIYYL